MTNDFPIKFLTQEDMLRNEIDRLRILLSEKTDIIKYQQAEIGRIKSGQVRLRLMSEAPKDQTQILALIRDYSRIFPDFWVQATRSARHDDKWFTEHGYIDDNLISGWIDLSDLPTEIEVTGEDK